MRYGLSFQLFWFAVCVLMPCRIAATSEMGKGSVFRFSLPLTRDRKAGPPDPKWRILDGGLPVLGTNCHPDFSWHLVGQTVIGQR